MSSPPRAWAEINISALDHNLRFIRTHSGQALMAVVKANAYGHGLLEIAEHLEKQDLTYLGVANVYEARVLSEAGILTPLYLLGATLPEERAEVVARGWTACLSTLEEMRHFEQLANEAKTVTPIHLALDTGMGRGGFLAQQLPDALQALKKCPHLQFTGLGSHLPSADEDEAFTRAQFESFDQVIESHHSLLQSLAGDQLPWIHLANSAGLLDYQSRTTNLVRPGLMLYGVSPLPSWQEQLQPVMTLKSRISLIRTLPAGHGVSYGRTHILEKDTRIATVGIGYGDGLPRSLSGTNVKVLVRNRSAALLGRVTMDQIMIEAPPESQVGDEVEIFGENLPLHHLSQAAQTIPWEILTRITPRVKRVTKS